MAVYTEVSDEALTAFLAEYPIGTLIAYRGIAEGVENSNYSLRTSTGDYILTLYEKRVDPADLPWFLALMRHLHEYGTRCPLPVLAKDGAALRQLSSRYAAITTFLPGFWPRRIQVSHCAHVGEALAVLHRDAANFTAERANALGPDAWRPLFARCAPSADTLQPGLGAEIAAALDRILAAWPQALPRGQIHADLFPDNVFFLSPTTLSGVIDFYFACTDLLAYDIAICINAWCFEPDLSFNATKSQRLLHAYDHIRRLTPAEHAALPVLCQGAAMRFLLTRLFDWLDTPPDALVTRKDPLDYLHRLRFHLAADTETYGF